MRQSFSNDLENIRRQLTEMGELVDKAMENAVKALREQDIALAQKVIDEDDIIDDMQIKIEDRCLALIALQQPLAKDLRVLGTALKITTDIERMGDHAKNIAEVALEIGKQPLIKPLVDIPIMAEKVNIMLKNSLKAYVELDIELAEAVCKADDEVDDLCDKILRDLLDYMMADPANINQASQLLYVARCMERMGDHTTNIAEWVVYMVTGQRIKGN